MKKSMLILAIATMTLGIFLAGCDNGVPTSDQTQHDQQERLLQEGNSQIGMPAIKNFREKKLLKDILELRDQSGLITYTYLENMNPVIVHGHTALGGKLTFFGESIGYGIPYATQFTNPLQAVGDNYHAMTAINQADPNGLFSPASAEGTWIMMFDPSSGKAMPQYIEPRIVVLTYKLPLD
ncbi:MAG: hypothetical protein KGH68_02610 [Patescibacteria group bacterium]|nr:hypothetical protein [Patescibacteria group bacterium]